MANVLMKLEGNNGSIELTNDRIIIYRRGVVNFFKYGLNTQREIPLSAISEVTFKNAAMLTMGSIEFVRGGYSSDEKKQRELNIVNFSKKQQPQFVELKEKLFALANARQRN